MCCKGKKNRFFSAFYVFFILSYFQLPALAPHLPIHHYMPRKWGLTEGLPCSNIHSIAQTPDGYLWLATTKGLVRFDGIKFSTLQYIKNQEINKIKRSTFPDVVFVDKKGTLWIGGIGGLTRYRYQTGTFTTFTDRDGLTGHRIRCINEDKKGNLWTGFEVNYLNRMTNNTFTAFNRTKGLEGKMIASILVDMKGNLLVGTLGNGIFKLRERKFFKYQIKGLGDNTVIRKLYEDKKGRLWIGTNKGLYGITNNVIHFYTAGNGLSNNDISDIIEDSGGTLWIGTQNGLNRMRVLPSGRIIFETLLEDHIITCLFEDNEKSLWVGTEDSGLKQLIIPDFFAHASTKVKNQGEVILSVFESPQGDIWLGSTFGRLYKYRKGKCIETLQIPAVPAPYAAVVTEDSNGNLWIGTMGNGVFLRNAKTGKYTNFTLWEGLANNYVTSVFEDYRNNLWISTLDGVSRYAKGNLESFTDRDGLLGKIVNNVYEDRNHNIWIVTSKGINVIKSGSFTKNNMTEYLRDIPVTCIHEDNGVSWIGTLGGGLKRFENGKFTSYTRAEGMISNSIYQILEDERGNLWMTSDNGVLRVNKKNLDAFARHRLDRINCRSFGVPEGMQSSEFYTQSSRNTVLKSRGGELWFVTKKGISIVDPEKVKINKIPPPVVIENAAFKGTGDVSVFFTAPTFLSPGKIKFKYKLEGYDRDWVTLSPEEKRMARYTKLPKGTYTFRVTACNSDGVWNSAGASMTITRKPSGFKASPFGTLLVLFILLVPASTVFFLFKKQVSGKITKVRHQHSYLNPLFARECLKKITYCMEIEKVYRDETISLKSLSDKISLAPHRLSQLLNEKLNKSFPDFINDYRIEEVKKRLTDPKEANRKIIEIAFDVGFNSKAAFNNAFKKFSGTTPSRYRENAKRSKANE